MIRKEPTAELDSQFSSDDATPIPWAEGRERLEGAEVYWISTMRPDGRPRLTPLLSFWLDGALYFCTGPTNARRRTSCVTLTVSLRLGATGSTRALTWWSKAPR
jgi:hypothetical protein